MDEQIAEYIALRIHCAARGVELPICAVYGIVETSLGLGVLVERIKDRWGNLAPTLRQLIERGEFDAFKERELSEFIDTLIDNHAVVYELSVDNIVFAESDGARRIRGRRLRPRYRHLHRERSRMGRLSPPCHSPT